MSTVDKHMTPNLPIVAMHGISPPPPARGARGRAGLLLAGLLACIAGIAGWYLVGREHPEPAHAAAAVPPVSVAEVMRWLAHRTPLGA